MKRIIRKIRYHYKQRGPGYEIVMRVDLRRFEQQYTRAQYRLDSQVMNCMVPFMPRQTGVFVNVTRAMSAAIAGSGKVYAAAPPFGRFLYEGKTMVDIATGSTFARRGAKKVLVSQYSGKTAAKEDLKLTWGNPRAEAHWFDAAKRAYGKDWIRDAKRTAGGGGR